MRKSSCSSGRREPVGERKTKKEKSKGKSSTVVLFGNEKKSAPEPGKAQRMEDARGGGGRRETRAKKVP